MSKHRFVIKFDTLEHMADTPLLLLYVHPLTFLRVCLPFQKFSLIFMNMDIR